VTAADLETALLIGGERHTASGGEQIEVRDPSTGEVIASVESASVDDALAAVDAATDAAASWAATSPRERGEVLRRTFELITTRADWFAELVARENGKALSEAKAEIIYAAEFFRWFSEEAARNTGTVTTAPKGGNRILVINQPVGVSVLVTPWNFPAAMATRKLGPALAAGCTTILKPASDTPLTALAIARVMEEAGVPPGVVNVLPSSRSSAVVKAMLDDHRVRKLSFTGSTEVGRILLAQAAERVVNCSMELGGNAPFIVFADADLDEAVAGAMVAKMRNGGESCVAANRFYAEDSIADEFAERFTKAMEAVRVGPPLDPDTELGPMINEPAVRKISELVEGCVSAGGRALTGARAPDGPGYYYLPTVLDHVPPDAEILRDEIFGPVAPIVRFTDVDEMITLANDTEYGLVCYVYTRDLAKGLSVSEALETGMVGLNRGLISDPAAPFGGVKQSGIGREGGHEGLLEFLESKYIAVAW
jgi:succinate-semialdehyde dehydrogenase / glutarate-semialdehyde dehydrogenase